MGWWLRWSTVCTYSLVLVGCFDDINIDDYCPGYDPYCYLPPREVSPTEVIVVTITKTQSLHNNLRLHKLLRTSASVGSPELEGQRDLRADLRPSQWRLVRLRGMVPRGPDGHWAFRADPLLDWSGLCVC